MFSALVIEDNDFVKNQIVDNIINLGGNPVYEASTAKEALFILSKDIPDIIFCDINLPDSNGIALAEKISLKFPNIGVVFITGYAEFAYKAFEINAIDYLVKPFSEERFRECMKKVYSYLNVSTNKSVSIAQNFLAVKVDSGLELIDQKDIVYINSSGKYSHIRITGKQNKIIPTTEALKFIETRLDKNMFMRTHRSYITNLNHISRIEPSGQTNLIYFNSCKDIGYLSKSHLATLYKKINFR